MPEQRGGSMLGVGGASRAGEPPHSWLPFHHHFIVAPPEGGKTSYLSNFFIRQELAVLCLFFYHKIYFVSTHCGEGGDPSDDGYEMLEDRNNHGRFVLCNHMTPRRWRQLIFAKKDPVRPSLVILDDSTGDTELMKFICGNQHQQGIIRTCSHPERDHCHIWLVAHHHIGASYKGFRDAAKMFTFFNNAVSRFAKNFVGSVGARDVVVTYPGMTYAPLHRVVEETVCERPDDFIYVNTLVHEIDPLTKMALHDRTIYKNFTHFVHPKSAHLFRPAPNAIDLRNIADNITMLQSAPL